MTEIERAVKKNLILIMGEEDLLRTRALTEILASVPILQDDFDLQVFDAQSSSINEWVGSAGTSPFLAERRVVIVRHLFQIEPPKVLENIKGIGSNGLLILVGDSVGGTDDRKAKATFYAKAWEALVSKSDGSVLKFNVDVEKTRVLVKAEASKLGLAISEKAVATLVEITGSNFSRAAEELDKLSLFVGQTETISERHVISIVVPSREWNVFQLTDAIVDKRVGDALRQLRTLIGNVAKAEDAAFAQILPQISRYLKLLWQARVSIELKETLRSPSDRFRAMVPKKPSLLAEPPYRQSKYITVAKQLDLDSLSASLRIVAEADCKLKGSLPSFSAIDTLETMVLELTTNLQ